MLATIDIIIVGLYALALFFLAQWVSRSSGTDKNASDYFLAGKSLPWWAIGASLIAANISAEQIIGMSGSGYAIGLAIASYEWMAAITLILVGKYLLPVFLRAEIYTMPQFLQQRYDHRVRLVMAFFWLGVYVLVNLTSVLWLGALAINTVAGVELNLALLLLGVFAAGLLAVRRSQGRCADRYHTSCTAGAWRLTHCLDIAQRSIRRGRRARGLRASHGPSSREI